MRWLVLDMDDGLLRAAPTRKAALKWFMDHCDAAKVISRFQYRRGDYHYVVGHAAEDSTDAFIVREDVAHIGGWDPSQAALYPVDDKPHHYVARDPQPSKHTEA